jgi:hypothetical protein
VTFTASVQLLDAASVPPDNAIDSLPAVAVPPQVLASPVGEATRPVGSGSVNAAPVSGAAFGLVSVKVNAVLNPTVMGEAANVFANVGGLPTVNVAVAGLPVPPSFEVGALVMLTFTPRVVPRTSRGMPHALSGGRVRFVMEIVFSVATMVLPLLQPASDLGTATMPGGSVSVTETPVSVVNAFPTFSTVITRNPDPPTGIDEGWKLFSTTGGCTVSWAFAGAPGTTSPTAAMLSTRRTQRTSFITRTSTSV